MRRKPVTRVSPAAYRRAVSAVVMLLIIGSTPTVADAHGKLKSSEPAAGAHLAAVPRELRLDFSEVPELTFTTVQLLDPAGQPVELGPVAYAADSKRAIVVAVRGRIVGGAYTVVWQMAGTDGHPVRDRFRFVVAPGATGTDEVASSAPAATTPGAKASHDSATMAAEHHDPVSMPEGRGFGAESPVYVLVRWALFIGLLLTIGAVCFQQIVLRLLRRNRAPDMSMLDAASHKAAGVGHRAAQALMVVVVVRLYAQSVAMHGARAALDPGLIGPMLVRTTWGYAWLVQVCAIVVADVAFRRAKARASSSAEGRRAWAVAAASVVLLAFTPGWSGHAVAAPQLFPLGVVADGVHVLSAGGWLGSLALVLLAGIPAVRSLPDAQRGRGLADLFNAFSPTALACAGLLVATGVVAAWLHVGSVSGLWRTHYGRILLLKLGVLSVVVLTGAYNWLRVKPALAEPHGLVRIRRSATVELAVAVAVLLITAVLVATPTAMDAMQ